MLSLREIQEQEEAAALSAALAASAAQAQPASEEPGPAADDDDGGLFWDYGVQGGSSAPPPPPARAAVAAAPRKPAAPAAKPGGWASTVAATTAAPHLGAPPAPPPRALAAPAVRAAVPLPPAQPAAQRTSSLDPADAAAISAALSDGSSALQGEGAVGSEAGAAAWQQLLDISRQCHGGRISPSAAGRPPRLAPPRPAPAAGAFRAWCAERMRELTGSPDVSLPEFLLTVESNSELAEYCTLYLGSTPAVGGWVGGWLGVVVVAGAWCVCMSGRHGGCVHAGHWHAAGPAGGAASRLPQKRVAGADAGRCSLLQPPCGPTPPHPPLPRRWPALPPNS